jgi:drug/metabolite transporter (DMT)-like permease
MTVCGLLAGGRIEEWTASGVAMLLYLATVSAVAYSLWGILLKYNPVSKVAVFGFMNPVFGVILSAILLSEEGGLSIASVGSLVLVCVGIYIVNAGKN